MVAGIAGLLTACVSDMGAARPVMVANGTDQTLDVSYELRVAGVGDVIEDQLTLTPGVALEMSFSYYGERCAPGRIVARAAGAIVATLDKPCQGDRWDIGLPDPSPS